MEREARDAVHVPPSSHGPPVPVLPPEDLVIPYAASILLSTTTFLVFLLAAITSRAAAWAAWTRGRRSLRGRYSPNFATGATQPLFEGQHSIWAMKPSSCATLAAGTIGRSQTGQIGSPCSLLWLSNFHGFPSLPPLTGRRRMIRWRAWR